LKIESHTWIKESHGLFDYDLKDVLTVHHETRDHTEIIRQDLIVSFLQKNKSSVQQNNLIAKIAHSGNKHWWIYH
jgi:hypothetical protein